MTGPERPFYSIQNTFISQLRPFSCRVHRCARRALLRAVKYEWPGLAVQYYTWISTTVRRYIGGLVYKRSHSQFLAFTAINLLFCGPV
jgi:hypothetical protein